ncbi:Na(+) H(+) antiporter subunit C [Caenispirillum salinarum AK4]|uniref:Na(+) H(+) antiporter subunit C n=1 Tax=Caenispirillum salinarum AK4 TaxID=1238182 RepID=K9HGH8_9PROT|nr:NADH-quinone oxidoreductase subunit K [Caenispirillum salinarum]EKV29563.1 Na(+) H(+) antiporter subunit C [Caenispirillum salinarum AK4]
MEPWLAILTGLLTACALYLVMCRNLVRIVLGTVLLAHAINLAVLTSGRLTRAIPPIAQGEGGVPETAANALPQALILTAIVISFGLLMSVLVLAVRLRRVLGTVDTDRFRAAEPPPDVAAAEDEHRRHEA